MVLHIDATKCVVIIIKCNHLTACQHVSLPKLHFSFLRPYFPYQLIWLATIWDSVWLAWEMHSVWIQVTRPRSTHKNILHMDQDQAIPSSFVWKVWKLIVEIVEIS